MDVRRRQGEWFDPRYGRACVYRHPEGDPENDGEAERVVRAYLDDSAQSAPLPVIPDGHGCEVVMDRADYFGHVFPGWWGS